MPNLGPVVTLLPKREKMFKSNIGTMFAAATSTLKNPAAWLTEAFGGGGKSSSGININIKTVLGIPEVYAAVTKISGHIAQMPMTCNETRGEDVLPFTADAGARAMARPHDFITRFSLMEKLMIDALIYGNARAYIERNNQGQPIGLIPMQAEDCTTVISDGERWHMVTINEATLVNANLNSDGGTYRIPDRDVFYIQGISRNGLWGESMLDLLRDQFGLAIAGSEATGSMFRNAGRPGMILESPRGAFRTAKEAQEFLDQFNSAHEGIDKAGKTGMLREGMTAKMMPADNNSSNYGPQRQFGRESMAIAFLQETVLGDNTGASYKSVTERHSAYVQNCLSRWIDKIQTEANMKLLSQRQKNSWSFEYKLDANVINANNYEHLANYTSNLRTQGIMSANEARRIHGLNPVPELEGNYSLQDNGPEKEEPTSVGVEAPDTTEPTTNDGDN